MKFTYDALPIKFGVENKWH